MVRGEGRDFSSFELGDNVGVLGDYVLMEVAAHTGLCLEWDGLQLASNQLNEVEALLRSGRDIDGTPLADVLDVGEAASLVRQSGICKKLNRSLWNEGGNDSYTAQIVASDTPYAFGVAARQVLTAPVRANTIVVASNRIMDGAADTGHPQVQQYLKHSGTYPTEYDYVCQQFVPELHQKIGRRNSDHVSFDVISSQEASLDPALAEALSQGNFINDDIVLVNVAGQGIEVACDLHRIGRSRYFPEDPEQMFDTKRNPQVFIQCAEMRVAKNEKQLAQPERYLDPYEGMRRIVAVARALARVSMYYTAYA